jgi:thioredoxin reductase
MDRDTMVYDVLIVGGGSAGLSAALILGRARRKVLVFDDGNARNAAAREMHGFLTRDGTPPGEMKRVARSELTHYPTVQFLDAQVVSAEPGGPGFLISMGPGEQFAGKRLLIATGVFDQLPKIEGLAERWGKSVFVCPFCDGWEVRETRIAVYGAGREAVGLAQELRGWTHDLVVAVERDDLTENDRRWIEGSGAALRVGTVTALAGRAGTLEHLDFADGQRVACRALFVSAPLRQHSPLFAALGCRFTADGMVSVNSSNATTVAGCYAAGDAVTKHHQVVLAVASGAAAAITISCDLLQEEADDCARAVKPVLR